MLQQAAIALGIELVTLGERADEPAARVVARHLTGAVPPTLQDLRALAAEVDVITVEHELLDLDAVRSLEEAGVCVAPSSATLARVIDKEMMRTTMQAAGLPGPRWQVIDSPTQIDAALAEMPAPVLKVTRGGYDGRGVVLTCDDDHARAEAEGMLAAGHRVLVEQRVPLSAEIAVVAVRSAAGEVRTYAPVRTVQAAGQCRQVDYPCGLDAELIAEAESLAARAAEAVAVVGLLAVEMFVVEGRLMINECAARPHNSGHLTIEAAAVSQFAQHLRAVAALPLGSTAAVVPAATMVNLIGAAAQQGAVPDPRDHLAAGLAVADDAHVHLYDKQVRPERKVGHVTLCATSPDVRPDNLAARAWQVAVALGAQPMPPHDAPPDDRVGPEGAR